MNEKNFFSLVLQCTLRSERTMIVLCSMYGRIPGLLLLAHSESLSMEKKLQQFIKSMLLSYIVILFSLQIFQIPTIKIKTPDRPTFRFLSKTILRSQHISTIYIEITFIGILCPSSTMQ